MVQELKYLSYSSEHILIKPIFSTEFLLSEALITFHHFGTFLHALVT